ncbi:MAG: hypothetical protein J2P36_29045, partial [Ktedonobacteraceae bacterium]|nr:hypothetical protein [Ktedonobacteraceae bacterium]
MFYGRSHNLKIVGRALQLYSTRVALRSLRWSLMTEEIMERWVQEGKIAPEDKSGIHHSAISKYLVAQLYPSYVVLWGLLCALEEWYQSPILAQWWQEVCTRLRYDPIPPLPTFSEQEKVAIMRIAGYETPANVEQAYTMMSYKLDHLEETPMQSRSISQRAMYGMKPPEERGIETEDLPFAGKF